MFNNLRNEYEKRFCNQLAKFIGDKKESELQKHFADHDMFLRVTKTGVYSVIYAENADFPRFPLARQTRGLFFRLVDGKVKIVAFPFTKFFNYNEHQDVFPDEFKDIMASFFETDEKVYGFYKYDGDIIKLYFDGKWEFGSNNIPGEIPKQMKKFLETVEIDFSVFDPKKTYMFEFTAPLMHVTMYDKPQLTLIGIKHNETEKEDDITKLGKMFNVFPVADYEELKSIEDAQKFVDSQKPINHVGAEGLVLYKYNGGNPIRFKLKSKEWLNQSKYSNSKIMIAGIRQQFFGEEKTKDYSDYTKVIDYLPSVKEQVKQISNVIKEKVDSLIEKIEQVKKLDKKDMFKELSKHEFCSVGIKFMNKDFEKDELFKELFVNKKTLSFMKTMFS